MLAQASPGPSVLPDLPDAEDKLDFAPYANTLRDIILNPNTQTPLTIGIFGSWGSGKTSLMKMIENRLKSAVRDGLSEQEIHTTWFNAWLYSKETSLWRSLIAQVLNGVRKWRSDNVTARQDLDELSEHLQRAAGPAELGHLSITAANLLREEGTDSAELTLTLQHGLDLLENVAEARQQGEVQAAMALRDQVRRATAVLEQERIESLDRFQQEFKELIEKYVLPHGYLAIFVDDLDRCLPEKAVEVLEAIKLFLDVPGCIFILGIDRDVVERGIRLRYGEMGGTGDRGLLPLLVSDEAIRGGTEVATRYRAFLQDLLEGSEDIIDGRRYLEKIVQIPFVLPPISPDAMGRFIAQLAPGLPHPECGLVFAQGLEPNPRQVKRAINIFTLLWELSRNREELAPLIKPVRLAKLVVIQQRHAELYELLREDPTQLIAWETVFRQKQDRAGFESWEQGQGREPSHEMRLPDKVDTYDLLPALEALLTMHPLADETAADFNFANLTADEARTYVFLTRTVKESVAEPAPPPITPTEEMLVEPLVSDEGGIWVEYGLGASRRGFVTGTIYGVLDPLLKRAVEADEIKPDLRQEILVNLATAGSNIYAQVASDPSRQAEWEVALAEPTIVRVSSAQSEAQIPWEIVYDRPLSSIDRPASYAIMQKVAPPVESEEIDLAGFWGLKHIIERPMASGYEKQAAPPSEIPVQDRPAVNLGLDMGSPQFERVREIFESWSAEGLIDLAWFDYPPDFREALTERPADIYVLHGRGGTEGGEIWIDFGKERLTRRTLESWKTGKRGSALFCLDVGAGLGRGQDWWAWLEAFRDLGVGGVIAPVVALHPTWTSNFTARFIRNFLAGEKAGVALRATRREFFEERGNPLGLFYAHFGPAGQRLFRLDDDDGEEEE